ncbi:MAG: GNAT family N-acetyltransferase [Actinobacteria bacterium]|nr:GNAT family N-acetyltransferase [Actinomycetota bacterium]
MTLLHLIGRRDWHRALAAGHIERAPEGFVHLSTDAQVVTTAHRYYAGADDLLVLAVEEQEIEASLRWEESRPGECFPHVYREVPLTAVRGALWFPRPFAVPAAASTATIRRAHPDRDAANIPALGDVVDGRRPARPSAEVDPDRVDRYRQLLRETGGVSLAYEEGGRMLSAIVSVPSRAAFGRGEVVPGRAHISAVATHPDAWGRGLASLLLHHLDRALRQADYDHAQLWTHTDNRRAQRVYERHGYTLTGAPRAFDARGDPIMQYEHAVGG